VLGIVPIECVWVDENRCGFFKRDTVFLEVVEGLVGVPREHICVYTLIGRDCKWGKWRVTSEKEKDNAEARSKQRCAEKRGEKGRKADPSLRSG
jgi:hypothetical protein